jgi:DNA-binding MarR family transcriptional regulator
MDDGEYAVVSPQERVLIAIRRIIQSVDLHSRYLSKNFGLTGPQLMVLRALSQSQSLFLGDLARAISLRQATVTGIAERLENRGLITRIRNHSDRRKVDVRITPEGEILLHQAPPLMQESFVSQFERLQDWEQWMILSALQRVVEMMEASEIDAAPILACGPIGDQPEEINSY